MTVDSRRARRKSEAQGNMAVAANAVFANKMDPSAAIWYSASQAPKVVLYTSRSVICTYVQVISY